MFVSTTPEEEEVIAARVDHVYSPPPHSVPHTVRPLDTVFVDLSKRCDFKLSTQDTVQRNKQHQDVTH